jgi:hypothetical protein
VSVGRHEAAGRRPTALVALDADHLERVLKQREGGGADAAVADVVVVVVVVVRDGRVLV